MHGALRLDQTGEKDTNTSYLVGGSTGRFETGKTYKKAGPITFDGGWELGSRRVVGEDLESGRRGDLMGKASERKRAVRWTRGVVILKLTYTREGNHLGNGSGHHIGDAKEGLSNNPICR